MTETPERIHNLGNNKPTATYDDVPSRKKVRVGITQGDTNGIGWELILRTFADSELLTLFTPIVYGHAKVANFNRKALGINTPFRVIASASEAEEGKLNLVNLSDDDVKVDYGMLSAEAGHAAFLALEQAVLDLQDGLIDTLVTCPINKANIQSSNFRFVGHTEYLSNRLAQHGEEPLMILCNDIMRVALVTTHLPISEVSFAINQESVEQKVRLLFESLKQDFNISAPRIAVLALNPHAGDNGLIGREEIESITPAVQSLAEAGLACYGPYAADGFFGSGLYRHFDGILAMYHDQGLTAFKALTTEGGVNFTAGLPYVRTSPDHGTAYDIAGKGLAQTQSFRKAIYSAIDIFRNRESYNEAHANPLPKLYHDRREDERGLPNERRAPRQQQQRANEGFSKEKEND